MAGNQWKSVEYRNNARHYFTFPRWTVLQESGVPSFIDTSVSHLDVPLTCSVCFQVYEQCTCKSNSQFESDSEDLASDCEALPQSPPQTPQLGSGDELVSNSDTLPQSPTQPPQLDSCEVASRCVAITPPLDDGQDLTSTQAMPQLYCGGCGGLDSCTCEGYCGACGRLDVCICDMPALYCGSCGGSDVCTCFSTV